MCFERASLTLLLFALALPVRATWISPFISEIHYDNAGGDENELIAVTGPGGLSLSAWQLVLYNGSNGRPYNTVVLAGQSAQADGGWAEAVWWIEGIQNGPDAVALVSPTDEVVDFIAYEAAVTATEGPALGSVARLLPVAEGGATAATSSLQRLGSADDWSWVSGPATPGILNPGLEGVVTGGVPVIGVLQLWLGALALWLLGRRVRRRPPGRVCRRPDWRGGLIPGSG